MKKVKIFLISLIIFSLSSQPVQANKLPFFDDFESNRETWSEMYAYGDPFYKWKILDGKYGMKINHPSTTYDALAGEESWADYEYELEMHPLLGSDKNFMFRYQINPNDIGRNAWYEIHAVGSGVILSKKGGGKLEDPTKPTSLLLPISKNYQIKNNSIYTWRVRVKENRIQVYVKETTNENETLLFDVVDINNPLLYGRVGLRIGTGSSYPTEVYFDNIKVTDLSAPPPTPEPEPDPYLDVPHFSQNNEAWAQEEYDFASKWNPENTSIDRWGCALASAAMILNYHGYDLGFEDQPTNPYYLNKFLNFAKGYQNNGFINWNYISQYAQLTKTFNEKYADYPSLEFIYDNYDFEILKEEIEASRPSILKIVINDKGTEAREDDDIHFVVAKGITPEGDIYINDPEDSAASTLLLSEAHPDGDIRQIGRFIESNTDLSYIWAAISNPEINVLVENQGNKTGQVGDEAFNQMPGAQYYQEGSLFSIDEPADRFGDENTGARIWTQAKPNSGNYIFTLSANKYLNSLFQLHTFDDTAKAKLFENDVIVFPGWAPQYQLTLDKTDSTKNSFERLVSFQTLRELINASHEQGWIPKWTSHKYFVNLTLVAEKVYGKNETAGNSLLDVFEKNLVKHHQKTWIEEPAFSLIQNEVSLLRGSL